MMTSPQTSYRRFLLAATGAIALAAAMCWPAPAAAAWPWSETVKGNGKVARQERPLAHFTGISLSLPAQVEIRIGSTESVSIEADENLLALVETVIEDGDLEIRARKDYNLQPRTLKIVVQAKAVNHIALGGSGSVEAEALSSPKLTLEIGGSGSINIKRAESESVAASIGGSGNVKLGGAARKLEVAIGGSGGVQAGQLKADNVEVSIGGSGDVTVWAANTLKATVAGSGDVGYYGDPKVQSTVVGSGGAKRLGPAPR